MKKHRFSARMVLSSVVLAGIAVPTMVAVGHAAPRKEDKLPIWPGQRVALILPITAPTEFEGGQDLAQAIIPLIQQDLRTALASTGKFSVVAPYRFDPVLRRSVAEKALAETDVENLLTTPSLESAQNVLGKIKFDQPSMVLDTKLLELVVGGTPKAPTAQIQVSGSLYEVGGGTEPKNITVRSRSYPGATPAARLHSAAIDAFTQMAMQLVEPPASFQLPAPLAVAPVKPVKAAPVVPPTPAITQPAAPILVPPTTATIKEPSALSPAAGQPFVPQLPPAQPPLNIAVGEGPVPIN